VEKAESILKRCLKKRGLGKSAQAAFICQKANQALRGMAQAVLYKDGVLTILVPREYSFQMQAESQKWLKEINKKLKKDEIKRIRLRIEN
jgi:hypothetical protein